MKKIASILFVLSTVISFAQSKVITGAVYVDQAEDGVTSSGVRIENLRSYAKTVTNYDGHFSIGADVGDTIQFTASFLVPRKIVVSNNIYNRGVLQVHLDMETIELQEVYLGKLDKNLNSNIKYKSDLKGALYNSIGLDQRLRDLEPKKDISKFKPMDVLSPVRMIGHINGYYKKQRRIELFMKNQGLLNEVINYFPDEFFLDELKIPDYKVQEFILYADRKVDLKAKVRLRQFELIGLELTEVAEEYLSELYQNQK